MGGVWLRSLMARKFGERISSSFNGPMDFRTFFLYIVQCFPFSRRGVGREGLLSECGSVGTQSLFESCRIDSAI
jgi:hypothetical protein